MGVTAVLLSVHVLAAIVFIGPVTVAASLFPRYARTDSARLLHRISRGYAVAGLAVPVFGIATAQRLHVLTQTWLVVSMALTLATAVLLAAVIVPSQSRILAGLDLGPDDGTPPPAEPRLRRLSMLTGLFALGWAVVVVLMIVRPGSTTGVTP